MRHAVIVILVVLAASAAIAQPARPSATWGVQKYDLNVTLGQDERSRSAAIRAVLNIANVSSAPAGTLTLRISPSAEVTGVQINGAAVEFAKSEEKINPATSIQRIAIRLPSAAPGAVVVAAVDYRLTLKDNSALAAISPAATNFLPLSFWYPTPNSWYFTRGADAAPFRIKVTGAPGLSVATSGAEADGGFEQKLNGQPFLIAGNWDAVSSNGVTVFIPKGVGAEGQKRAAELAALFAEARTFAAGVFGAAPPAPLRIIASRRGGGFAGGGAVIVDEGVFRRAKVDSVTAMNIAEAAAKLWLGGAIAVNDDGYGAITEGLSRYVATQFVENKFGKDVADVERLRQRTSYAAVSRRDAPMSIVSPLDDFYYPQVANKGAMVWRILARRVGSTEFGTTLRALAADGSLTLAELRSGFSAQKPLLDYLFDQITDTNLLAGLPQREGDETRVNLRNTGGADVTVDVAATTDTGERLVAPATVRAQDYGLVAFRTPNRVVRVEIDAEKLYPQTDYSDDVAPRETADSDPMLAVKRLFDKQDFSAAETLGRALLRDLPRFDDLRTLFARSLLAQNKAAEAEREFRAVLEEKLPSARSIAWANVGLAEIAGRSNQSDAALRFAEAAILADAEYGASLAARNLRLRLNHSSVIDPSIKTFFADFDRAARANRKAEVDALIVAGEIARFAGGVAGSTEQWQTQVRAVDRLDANTVLVEASMNIKLLNREAESGMAVYRLVRIGSGWKLAAVDMFEVR